MRKIALFLYVPVLLLLNFLALPETAQGSEDIDLSRQYAFIIGINDYKNNCPVNDCNAIEMLLDERYGFKKTSITPFYNTKATKQAIEAQFQSYRDKLTRKRYYRCGNISRGL